MPDDEVLTLARTRIGKVLRGKYRLDRVIGVGGMAVVYAATHRNKKKFAIKMLHPELSMRENIRTRFLREGYVANSVEHPGAVAVLDDDIAEDGSAFVVMELLEGAAVDEVWARSGKRVPLALVLSIGDALLDVLAAAHAKGIVHRDIKPANVFLTSDGRLSVLDFGIARLHDETSGAQATQTGAMMGTPAYMAPEQALAETAKVDGQTDLWAVGATLFSLLTGELVHPGENASQLLVNAATKKAREISSVAEEVPKKIGLVIDKALAFDKKDRWANAREMREALAKACLDVTGAPVAPLPKIERAAESVTGLEATITPDMMSAPGSSGAAFDPTVDASSVSSGAAGGGSVPQTTGAALSKSQNEPPTARRAPPWKAIGAGALACVAAAGGMVAYRTARAPRVRYCLQIYNANDGFTCGAEVGAEVLGKRGGDVSRVTESAGHVDLVEQVNFAGRLGYSMPTQVGHPRSVERFEIRRDGSGAVRDIIKYDGFGAQLEWQKWSDGGKRIDLVDIDGKTPRRGLGDGRSTTLRREYDAQGRVTRDLTFGPTGRPRADGDGAYGDEYWYGASWMKTKGGALGADGAPGANAQGFAFWRRSDNGLPWGDLTFFDANDRPIAVDGVHEEVSLHNDYESTGFSSRGLHGEPVTSLAETVHEARHTWDPSKHTWEWTIFDERGRPQVVRGEWFLAARETYDDRGRPSLIEFLDGQGNRVMTKNNASATRHYYDDHDHRVRDEQLDPAGALTQGADAYARREYKRDAHDNAVEVRYFDETGHLAPWKEGGAIERSTFDERDLRLTRSTFDADDQPVTNVHGFASEHDKYDRLRNLVEVAYFGPDGKPTMSDEGFAIKRLTYDENDDLVAVSYFDASGAPTPFESSYATQRLKNDERGLVVEEDYFDVHGDPILVKDGYASVKKTRDRNGDVVEEAYFGKRGDPALREGGFARRTTSFDVTRRPVEVALFGASGEPARGAAGWALERTTYDERGLVVRLDHLDATKNPALDRDGRASLVKVNDSRGNQTEEASLDAAGKPVATSDGYATKKTTYDDRDEVVEEALLGADGKAVSGKAGWSLRRVRYDDFGNVIEESFYDDAHDPVVPKDLAYSSMKQQFDERHRLAESAYFDVHGTPSKGSDGVAVTRYKHDGYGRTIETSYHDGTGAPSPSKDGRVVTRSKYDAAGHLVDERFVDASGAPRPGLDGCAGHHTKYDAQGRKLEESCLDAKDSPTLGTDGWALRRTLHDSHGNDVDVATYAPDGTLHADKDGVARRQNRFNDRNLLVETKFFDASEKPSHDKHGAHSVFFTYDDTGKKNGESRYDERNNALPPLATAKP